jgi:probable HAF family extracellular repeat protein
MSWFGSQPKRKSISRRTDNKRPAVEKLEDRCLLAYTITEVGTIGGVHNWGYGLNDAGTVVGASMVTGFRYSHAYTFNGTATDLGTLQGLGKFSVAEDINAAGHVVGTSNFSNSSAVLKHAFVYKNGAMTDLGALGGPLSFGTGINSAGVAVGYANYGGGGMDSFHAFKWDPALPAGQQKTDLGTLGGTDSKAYDINDSGQIAGVASNGTQEHAVLWNGAQKTDIGVLPGFQVGSEARAINSAGLVVGGSYAVFGAHSQKVYHGFLYNPSNGEMTDLGKLEGTGNWSFANDINDLGQIVGTANVTPTASYRAFVWSSGVMTNLNDEIPDGSGWLLVEAHAINNNGQIVGVGFKDGKYRAFRLDPVPSPIGSGRFGGVDSVTGANTRSRSLRALVEAPSIFRTSVAATSRQADADTSGETAAQTTTERLTAQREAASPEAWTILVASLGDPLATGG